LATVLSWNTALFSDWPGRGAYVIIIIMSWHYSSTTCLDFLGIDVFSGVATGDFESYLML
jgi:hypothetical protein